MSDKDNHYYNDLQRAYPYYNFIANESAKCLMCFQLIPQNIYLNYQIFCTNCYQKILTSLQPQSNEPEVNRSHNSLKISIHPPTSFTYPQSCLNNMIFVCDFLSHFSELIEVTPCTLLQLFESLSSTTIEGVCKEIYISLGVRLSENILKPDSEFKITEKNRLLYMGIKVSEVVDIKRIMICTWARIVGELIRSKCYSEYVKGSSIEQLKKRMPETLTETDINSLSIDDKVGILEFLVNSYLDSRECREFISLKVDKHVSLAKTRFDKKQRLRVIENDLISATTNKEALESERTQLVKEEEAIKCELTVSVYRTDSLGFDSKNNEYFFFKFEPDKLLVNFPGYSQISEQGTWYFYQAKQNILKLASQLIIQQKKENKLKLNIEKILKTVYIETIDHKTYANLFSNKVYIDCSLEKIKETLKTAEKSFTKYLKSSKKRWDIGANEKQWRNSLLLSTEVQELSVLLLEFAEKSLSPLRSQYNPTQKTSKYRKVILKLWQSSPDGYTAWEDFIKSICSKEELMLGTLIYKQVLEAYVLKKRDRNIKHSKECYKCNEGGNLILCEICPRVSHMKCANLTKISQSEWICEYCKLD